MLVGPLTFLYLAKAKGESFDKLSLLEGLLATYQQILDKLAEQGVSWVQFDEPILVLDLDDKWQQAFKQAYKTLNTGSLKILLTTYFGDLGSNTSLACNLPVAGLHIDCVRAPAQLKSVLTELTADKILSVGVVDGRNIWRNNLQTTIASLQPIKEHLGERLWISSSCSLLHTPVDLAQEDKLDTELKSWLAFATQKVEEIAVIAKALSNGTETVSSALQASNDAIASRAASKRVHRTEVKTAVATINQSMLDREQSFAGRSQAQNVLGLPLLPTTTIGSFPQTTQIRTLRRDFKAGRIDTATYETKIRAHIVDTVKRQEALGLDVLVHGEPERNDMVEYFGELMDGFVFTQFGWVQSYGSRCVKPPIIYGDVARPKAMTVEWTTFAQEQTQQLMKGMLTGPVTILSWSFPRVDISRAQIAEQIALALRAEVTDLEAAGIRVIQVDEPAFREGLPLRRQDWDAYLTWGVNAFRLACSGANSSTQIHTHMCYSDFNEIIEAIAKLDADVITLESSRSQMELLEAFEDFEYPNDIGPGVYDIHSPLVPEIETIVNLLDKAAQFIPVERLWVNPDCGLKTRNWEEVEQALTNMVAAAKLLRAKYGKNAA